MIAPATGEVHFEGGLFIVAHCLVESLNHRLGQWRVRPFGPPGWACHSLGEHLSDHALFEIEAVSGPEGRVRAVFLSHSHPFYERDTPEDSERRAYHEGIIAADLQGQREFSWGQVSCKLDRERNKDWLVVAYSQGAHVSHLSPEVLRHLTEHEKPSER